MNIFAYTPVDFSGLTIIAQYVPAASPRCLVTYGVKEAFTLVKYLYDVDPTSRASCHTLTHYIGSQAYRLFAKHTPFTLSPEIAYCSYGFYHGFAEELFRRGGNVSSAAEFCAYVTEN